MSAQTNEIMLCVHLILLPTIVLPLASTGCSRCSTRLTAWCATLLGAQDGECLEQAAKEPASKGQALIARYLDGGDQIRRRGRIRWLHRMLWRQVRESGRVPQQGPRLSARFLRLPCSGPEASTHDKPNREHVRDRPPSNNPNKGMSLEQDRARHDLQAGASRREKLAPSPRPRPVAESYPRW